MLPEHMIAVHRSLDQPEHGPATDPVRSPYGPASGLADCLGPSL